MSCDHNTGTGNGLLLGFGDGHRGEKTFVKTPWEDYSCHEECIYQFPL